MQFVYLRLISEVAMLNKSKTILLIMFFGSLLIQGGEVMAKKPSAPILVTITPTNKTLSPADIKPGDTVELLVTIKSFSSAQDMQVNVDLIGGTALVSGTTNWTGPMGAGEEKALNITVQAPLKGTGKIKARAVVRSGSKAVFGAEATYLLGAEMNKKPASQPKIKKDSRGRSVMEYK